jgi:hypothetical protein
MAAIALNTYKTVRAPIGINTVGIYTAPQGVSTIVLYAQVANVSTGIVTISAYHSRSSDGFEDVEIIKEAKIPPNDSLNILDGRLVLETGDILKIKGESNNGMKALVSILESAK